MPGTKTLLNPTSLITTLFVVLTAAAPGSAQQNNVTIDTANSPAADVTDWQDEACFADDLCNEPPDGQTDVTGACIASNYDTTQPATIAYLRFDFDDTSVSGANTLDGCWFVDVDQNGFVDSALCFSLKDPRGPDPLNLDFVKFFTCNDTTIDTCPGAGELASSASCAVNTNTTGGDLFPTCPGPDTAVECSISLAELGWTSGSVVLLQGCSSTAAEPNSNTFDCVGQPDSPLVIDPDSGSNTPVELLSFGID